MLLLDGLQGQFLLQQKVRIFFYKMMFAQKVNLLFSYFVAVTVCRDQRKDCDKNLQKIMALKFTIKSVLQGTVLVVARKLIVDEG